MEKVEITKHGIEIYVGDCKVTVIFPDRCDVRIDRSRSSVWLEGPTGYLMPIVRHIASTGIDKKLFSVLSDISKLKTEKSQEKWLEHVQKELVEKGEVSEKTVEKISTLVKRSAKKSLYLGNYTKLYIHDYCLSSKGCFVYVSRAFKRSPYIEIKNIISYIPYDEEKVYDELVASQYKVGKMITTGKIDRKSFKRIISLDEFFKDMVSMQPIEKVLRDEKTPETLRNKLLPYIVTLKLNRNTH